MSDAASDDSNANSDNENKPEFIEQELLILMADRPVGLAGDSLWKKESSIRRRIRQIADRLVKPLTPSLRPLPEHSESMTFAIYGKWGMGKSSALRMIKEEATLLAREKKAEARLRFCDYTTTAYEPQTVDAHGRNIARVTMTINALVALAGSVEDAVNMYMPDAYHVTGQDPVPSGSSNATTWKLRAMETYASGFSGLIDFSKFLEECLKKGDQSQVLVVLIDNLDRCKTDFVWQVLETVQQLSTVPNLFFVLAVDKEQLNKTVRERFYPSSALAMNPDFALEKYIQHSIILPDMEAQHLDQFVLSLINEQIPRGGMRQLIRENAHLIRLGLRVRTPRSVKRCLNHIIPELLSRSSRVDAQGSNLSRQQSFKELILEYAWPDFYHSYFEPVRSMHIEHRESVRHGLSETEKACRSYYQDRDQERLRFQLKRISQSNGFFQGWNELDLNLLEYLGTPPFWFIEDPSAAASSSSATDAAGGGSENIVEDLEARFLQLYVQGEVAESTGDKGKAIRTINELHKLIIDNRDRFTAVHSIQVGNAALTAETLGAVELALKLYELALSLDPEHTNNIQNFVSFIIDKKVRSHYDRASALLQTLKTDEKHADRRQRTTMLEVQFGRLSSTNKGESVSAQIGAFLEEFKKDPGNQQAFVAVAALLNQVGDRGAMREIVRIHYPHATTQAQRYIALRVLADTLATSRSSVDEFEAMEIYSFLIARGDKWDDHSGLLHNHATLLYKHDYNEAAGDLWFEAYNEAPGTENIRKAYSNYLLKTDRPELATKVANGQPLDRTEKARVRGKKAIPEHFTGPDFERWWEEPFEG